MARASPAKGGEYMNFLPSSSFYLLVGSLNKSLLSYVFFLGSFPGGITLTAFILFRFLPYHPQCSFPDFSLSKAQVGPASIGQISVD